MPIVSTFFGIVIRMYYQEHGVPHFHAEYQGHQVTLTFDGQILAGAMGSRVALRLIEEWTARHRDELDRNWQHAQAGEPLERIEPLD